MRLCCLCLVVCAPAFPGPVGKPGRAAGKVPSLARNAPPSTAVSPSRTLCHRPPNERPPSRSSLGGHGPLHLANDPLSRGNCKRVLAGRLRLHPTRRLEPPPLLYSASTLLSNAIHVLYKARADLCCCGKHHRAFTDHRRLLCVFSGRPETYQATSFFGALHTSNWHRL